MSRILVDRWYSGRGHRFGSVDAARDRKVQGKKLGEDVILGGEAVGVEGGGGEVGVGVLERVLAGEFQRSIESAEAALQLGQVLGADAADFAPGFCDLLDLLDGRRLGPGEGVEDGFGGVAEVGLQLRALGDEPLPVGVGLQEAEGIVVGEGERLKGVPGRIVASTKTKIGRLVTRGQTRYRES